MNLAEQLRCVVAALDSAEVSYALVGGLAVAVWGAPRATQDIDLLVRPEDVAAALDAVEPLGFNLKALPMSFRDGMQLQRVSKVEGQSLLSLDLLQVNPNLETVWASRRALDVDGTAIWVISRDALIQMKISAGRPQDQADVASLEDLDR